MTMHPSVFPHFFTGLHKSAVGVYIFLIPFISFLNGQAQVWFWFSPLMELFLKWQLRGELAMSAFLYQHSESVPSKLSLCPYLPQTKLGLHTYSDVVRILFAYLIPL